jgi:hypothetical protein
VHPLGGKTWAFAVEKLPRAMRARPPARPHLARAGRQPPPAADPRMGEVMYLLGIESARAY